MKLHEHELLAKEIAYELIETSNQRLLLLVMNEKEYGFYANAICTIVDKILTLRTNHKNKVYKIKLENGSELQIIRYTTQKSLDCWLCGLSLDEWWATTDLIPDEISTRLRVCSLIWL